MNLLLNLPLMQAAGGAAAMSTPIVTFALVIAIFYFLIIRPQNKKQKETKAMIESVEKGDKVTTIGGIRGTVDSVKDDIVSVRVYNDVKIDFKKSALSEVVKDKKNQKVAEISEETDKKSKKKDKE
ncbi:preprotein translocase subunit YajC [Spirochaeta isovalerica]|uniref:Sec translocon accessory complex subunit YajC n=1 Tax=Spirochaeta isovalerica TaxID=150 RepID=A0A841RAT0_9SPIO|nr:preprotein translocase subunit YajC [Spirochaeta isovalerica]MBB6482494.1 preprotein translocase subunit YajC [Spirochaeta isovalerica]